MKGSYKLEVWGAQGGDSAGNGFISDRGKGGLGGYSTGIISLTKPTKFFIYVGGQGKTGDSQDGSVADGGFPDGGLSKTGHKSPYTTVPGSGGGSSSIRVSTDSLFSRVIVAGGGGGASGTDYYSDHGGYGGGLSGCNCYYTGSLHNQGGGTQTGSSAGYGNGKNGDAGVFGRGAAGLYRQGSNSGGGGGGGWYGGGSGGYGNVTSCSGGGGGSGWIFTESSLQNWRSGNSSDASNYLLDASFYLTNASTKEGNTSFTNTNGNGNEVGHRGNGYAKITPQ